MLARHVSVVLGLDLYQSRGCRVHFGGVRGRQVVAEDGGELEDLSTEVTPSIKGICYKSAWNACIIKIKGAKYIFVKDNFKVSLDKI